MPHLLQLLLLLVIIVFTAKAAGALSVRYGQPAVFGEILVGLLLGPTAIDLLRLWPFASAHDSLGNVVKDFSEIGVILLMFVAGLETDLDEMKRVGRVAFWAAAGGVILPMAGGAAATRVSISAQTLMELKQLRSKEGMTILGAAVIDDVMGIIVLSLVVAFSAVGGPTGGDHLSSEATLPMLLAGALFNGAKVAEILFVVALMALFFAVSTWFGLKFFDRLLARAKTVPASQALLAFAVGVAFIYAFFAQYVGQVAAITGSYIAGVIFTRTRFKREIDEGIHPLTYSILVPVFFISIGLEADGRALTGDSAKLWLMAVILAVAVAGKVVGCGAAARLCGFNRQESLRVGVGMISRGEVGLIVAGVGLASGVIDKEIFSIMVIMVLVTTMITPLLLRLVFPRVVEERADVYESIAGIEEAQFDGETIAQGRQKESGTVTPPRDAACSKKMRRVLRPAASRSPSTKHQLRK